MNDLPFDEFARLDPVDRLVLEPARMVILTLLSACREADFKFLTSATGLTTGNLSVHLTKLADAELLTIDKDFVGKRPRTRASITPRGREVIDAHWKRMERLRHAASVWRPEWRPQEG